MDKSKTTIENNRVCVSQYGHHELSDQVLLSLISHQRDELALAELYKRYKHQIACFLRRKMCDIVLIEEVYNEVMLTVWQKAISFRGESKVSTWLFGIAYRTRLAHSKKETKHKHVGADELIECIHVDDQAETSIADSIHAAMSELSERHRTVIELSYFHGYNTLEIASIVDSPQNTIKTRLFHARKKLRKFLEAETSPRESVRLNKDKPSENERGHIHTLHNSLFIH